MKLRKKALIIPACLCLFTATSQAALVLEFNQVGATVVLTFSGSVDLTGSFASEGFGPPEGAGFGPAGTNFAIGIPNFDRPDVFEEYRGADLLGVPLASPGGFSENNRVGFRVNGTQVGVAHSQYLSMLENGLGDVSVLSSAAGGALFRAREIYNNTSFAASGLNAHAPDTLIDLWRVTGTTGTDNLIQFRVNSPVPEPSSTLVLGLSGLALMARRKRA